MPRVTVILSSLNHAKYLAAAIESVLNQTFADFELFIVDDASEDESWEIIQRYGDPRIKAIRNAKRMRAAYGFNEVIRNRARGEFIAIHHSDDLFLPNKLERQVAYLDTYPDVGAVFTQVEIIDEAGAPFSETEHFYSSVFRQPNRTRFEWLRHFFFHGNCLCHPSILARRSAYLAVGLYDRRLGQITDFELWIRMCLQFEIHILEEPLLKFRVRAGEANQSGDKLETAVRVENERLVALRNYANIADKQYLHKIFPEISNESPTGYPTLYHLAIHAIKTGGGVQQAFGLEMLFQLMSDATMATTLERLGFHYVDLIALSGKCDFFRSAEVFRLNSDCRSLKSELHRVKSTFSWRVTRPLRVMRNLLQKMILSKR